MRKIVESEGEANWDMVRHQKTVRIFNEGLEKSRFNDVTEEEIKTALDHQKGHRADVLHIWPRTSTDALALGDIAKGNVGVNFRMFFNNVKA